MPSRESRERAAVDNASLNHTSGKVGIQLQGLHLQKKKSRAFRWECGAARV